MAGGALMQLVAYGAQDVYLTGNPSITFFQAVYKKHTNFAMETIEQTVDGAVGNTGHCSVTVGRNGDLVGEMYLELTPVSTGVSVTDGCWVGERAISSIDLSIGGQRIDKHYQKWWRLYSELYMDNTERMNYGKMTSTITGGAATVSQRVYLPLIFFFNRNPGLYLPLIALQYHEVKIDINLNDTFETYFDKSLSCWANYVFLDSEERKRFAQTGHEYLIEQVQHTGNDSVVSNSVKQVRLAYNHPVKDLVWCFSSSSNGAGNDMWETTTPAALTMTLDPDGSNFVPNISGVPLLSDGGFPLEEETIPIAATNVTAAGPLSQFKLILNGQDRFKEQPGKYFNQVQPYQHYSGSPYPGIYAYSFALKPGDHQPTGTCNFSRIDNSVAWVSMKTSAKTQLNMFAVNYNILRVQSGMGGLAFSN